MGAVISKLSEAFNLMASGVRNFGTKYRCEDYKAHLLEIPVEIRETILTQLPPRERQMLRLVCSQLTNEIDHLVGPVTSINISDIQNQSYFDYFSKIYVSSIKVIGPCTTLTLDSVMTYPTRLKSFTLTPEANSCSDFVSQALNNCRNLTQLNISGKVEGVLSINLTGGRLHLPKLTSLTLNSNNFHHHPFHNLEGHIQSFVSVLNGQSFDSDTVMAFWHNQSTLLRVITAPKLKEATLFLHTLANAPAWEEISEVALMKEFLQFLGRHKGIKKLKLYHGERLIESRLFEYHTPLRIFKRANEGLRGGGSGVTNDLIDIDLDDLASPGKSLLYLLPTQLQEFEFCSALPTQFEDEFIAAGGNPLPIRFLESHVLNLAKSFKGLTKLKFSGTTGRSLSWSHLEKVISSNAATLKHFEIVGKLSGPIDFDILTQCPKLKVIMINNKQKYRRNSPSPVIENFNLALTSKLGDNLETLILQNIGLSEDDLESLTRLRNLTHLAIYRWRCGVGDETLTHEGIKRLLAIPTIKSLLVPWPRVIHVPNLDSALSQYLEFEEEFRRRARSGAKSFLHPKDARKMGVAQYLCIEEEGWEVRSKGQSQGQQQGRIVTPPISTSTTSTPIPALWRRTEWGIRMKDNFEC